MAARILVVDDDPDIRDVVEATLITDGFEVSTASSAEECMRVLRNDKPQLAILDIMMETRDAGIRLCQRIRAQSDVPVIFLTAKATQTDAVVGLESGADDYITKPFGPRELCARVRAVLRRSAASAVAGGHSEPLRFCGLTLDTQRQEVLTDEHTLPLSRTEFLMLRAMGDEQGIVFSRERLIEIVYGSATADVSPRTIDSHVRKLRAKLSEIGADPVETVRGVGYRVRRPR